MLLIRTLVFVGLQTWRSKLIIWFLSLLGNTCEQHFKSNWGIDFCYKGGIRRCCISKTTMSKSCHSTYCIITRSVPCSRFMDALDIVYPQYWLQLEHKKGSMLIWKSSRQSSINLNKYNLMRYGSYLVFNCCFWPLKIYVYA